MPFFETICSIHISRALLEWVYTDQGNCFVLRTALKLPSSALIVVVHLNLSNLISLLWAKQIFKNLNHFGECTFSSQLLYNRFRILEWNYFSLIYFGFGLNHKTCVLGFATWNFTLYLPNKLENNHVQMYWFILHIVKHLEMILMW